MPKRDPILDLLDEKDKIIRRQADIIRAADVLYGKSLKIPQSGNTNNRELADAGEAYAAAKDGAKKEQEG